MLGRLFVHEWKDTWKLMTILNGAVLALSFLGMAFAATGNMADIFKRDNVGSVWVFLMYMSFIMIYILGIFALSIGTTLYFYIRFYRNMYTDQGYLMHTLPVTEHDLILSKSLVAFIWKAISALVVGVGISAIVLTFASTTSDVLKQIMPYGRDMFDEYVDQVYAGNAGLFFLYILVMFITGVGSIVYTIFMGYAAISLGQQAKRNKVLASLGIYFGISIAVSMLTNMINQFVMLFAVKFDSDAAFRPGRFGAASIGISFLMGLIIWVMAAVFYVITHRIMVKNLNLE